MRNLKIIGVTGGCGTGKSTVAKMLEERGGHVIDADAITKELQKKGAVCYMKIKEWLGEDYLLPDGELDRKKIAELVFSDSEARKKINQIVHTEVAKEIKKKVSELQKNEKEGFIVLDVPIPVEKGFLDTADVVWSVISNSDLRVERLVARMGISEEDAEARINSQPSNSEYEAIADRVLENEEDLEYLKKQVDNALEMVF